VLKGLAGTGAVHCGKKHINRILDDLDIVFTTHEQRKYIESSHGSLLRCLAIGSGGASLTNCQPLHGIAGTYRSTPVTLANKDIQFVTEAAPRKRCSD
jgi:hypothetical protein